MSATTPAWLSGAALACALAVGCAAPRVGPPRDAAAMTPEEVVRDVYALVSFEAGTTPDWEAVRAHFLDEAVIVLRTSREDTTTLSLDGFVADFVAFIERADAERRGFTETVLRLRDTVFGDIAHVLVLYEAELGDSARGPSRGVDSFHLVRRGDRWRIASVLNELPTPDRPVPDALRD